MVEDSKDLIEILEHPPKKKRDRGISYKWSEHEIAELIQAVETKPELWKPNHESYRNRKRKDAAWLDIEENVFNSIIKVTEITSKWNSLRVQYKSCTGKYKMKPSTSERGHINKWKHFDAMRFIGANDEFLTETCISNLTPALVFTDSDSTATISSVQSTSHVRHPTPASRSASSSRTAKSKKATNSDRDNDDLVLQGIQLGVDNLKESNDDHRRSNDWKVDRDAYSRTAQSDEFNIFGQFVAAEIKRLPNDYQRQQLKRIIQRAIMNFNENLEHQN